ncbi:hypothetical protein Tco_0862943 [Tanacetum coccineum]
MINNQKPSGDKLGLGFNSFEASSSGTKEIKFVKAQKKASPDGGPINMGDPFNVEAAPKINMGPPPATPESEKTVSFQKSILGPRPKHIIVNKAKVPIASNNESEQFYKPLSKPGVRFSKPNFRSKTPPPRRVNNNYSRPKTPLPKKNDDDDDDDIDNEDEEPFEDEDDDVEEKEHLALADSSAVPIVDPVPSAGDTETFETDKSAPTPRSPQTKVPFARTRLRRARKTVRLEPPMSPSMEASSSPLTRHIMEVTSFLVVIFAVTSLENVRFPMTLSK